MRPIDLLRLGSFLYKNSTGTVDSVPNPLLVTPPNVWSQTTCYWRNCVDPTYHNPEDRHSAGCPLIQTDTQIFLQNRQRTDIECSLGLLFQCEPSTFFMNRIDKIVLTFVLLGSYQTLQTWRSALGFVKQYRGPCRGCMSYVGVVVVSVALGTLVRRASVGCVAPLIN